MTTLEELRKERLQKLAQLREKGIDPYPAEATRTHPLAEISRSYQDLENKTVTVCGRITAIRTHGQLLFMDLKDASGTLQLYLKADNLVPPDYALSQLGFADLHLLDRGDFVESTGSVTRTKTGEISLAVTSIKILTKSLRPLPNNWHGLKDTETRLRRRYLDLNVNEDVYQRFIRRSRFWQAHRQFFQERGFWEINIPVLEHIPGGADATPFVTHMAALDQDFYLRISQELYLKRLIGGGYEKVYEIGPRFRNEGISEEHLPEHIAMEFYSAYTSMTEGIHIIKDLFQQIIATVYDDRRQFTIRGVAVDFGKEWEMIDYTQKMKEVYGIDILDTSLKQVHPVLEKQDIKVEQQESLPRCIDKLFKELRKEIVGPAFVINIPKFLSPLAKASPADVRLTQRFQPVIAGSELGNGFSELNDPLDQLVRFKEQQSLRDSGDTEAQFMDIDFVEMLEYGMPPTFGYGHSERVFWFLEDIPAREGVPFPQLKTDLEEVTKRIYDL